VKSPGGARSVPRQEKPPNLAGGFSLFYLKNLTALCSCPVQYALSIVSPLSARWAPRNDQLGALTFSKIFSLYSSIRYRLLL
jgi:hypothetical protein